MQTATAHLALPIVSDTCVLLFSPAIVLGVYIYGIEKHHYDHMVHEYHENDNQPPERTFYEYNNIRRKAFPWGDGSKSFFHNHMINYEKAP